MHPPPCAQTYPSQPYPQQGTAAGLSAGDIRNRVTRNRVTAARRPAAGLSGKGSQQGYPQGGSYPSQSSPSYGNNSVQPQPRNVSGSGGVSFEISPSDAAVFVDGSYVGTVDQFGPQTEPLRLTPGRHRIELRASGMQTMAFDTVIAAGQVIPHRGTLQQR